MSLTRFAGTLLFCGALAAGPSDAPAQALKKINDGQVSPTAPNWPSFIAVEKGFFRREGVELETSYVGNVANTVQQLVGGSFDVAVLDLRHRDPRDRQRRQRGADRRRGDQVSVLDHDGARHRDGRDLKGKRIILPFAKDLLTIVWNRWVTEKGMRPDDIEQVYAGATPNRLAALVERHACRRRC